VTRHTYQIMHYTLLSLKLDLGKASGYQYVFQLIEHFDGYSFVWPGIFITTYTH